MLSPAAMSHLIPVMLPSVMVKLAGIVDQCVMDAGESRRLGSIQAMSGDAAPSSPIQLNSVHHFALSQKPEAPQGTLLCWSRSSVHTSSPCTWLIRSALLSGRAPVSSPRSSFWSVSAPCSSVPQMLFLLYSLSTQPLTCFAHLLLFYSSYFRNRPPTTMSTLAEKPARASFMVPAGRRLSRMDSKTLRKSSFPRKSPARFPHDVFVGASSAHLRARTYALDLLLPETPVPRRRGMPASHVPTCGNRPASRVDTGQFVTRSFRRLFPPPPFCYHLHRLFLHRQQHL